MQEEEREKGQEAPKLSFLRISSREMLSPAQVRLAPASLHQPLAFTCVSPEDGALFQKQ